MKEPSPIISIIGLFVIFTVVVVALLGYLQAGWGPILLTASLSLCWAVAGGLLISRQNGKTVQRWRVIDDRIAELTAKTSALLGFMAREFNGQFDMVKNENRQMQDILADAIERLVSSFTGMDDHSRRQLELATALTGKGAAGRGALDFESLCREIEEVLNTFVEAAGENSRVAKKLLEEMTATSSQFHGVLTMLDEVKKIADQTNLLAINATVEAARAGQAGKGFAVVAGEVRNLSVHSNKFSDKIGDEVSGIAQALNAVENTIGKIAKNETSLVASTQERVRDLTGKLHTFNTQVEKSAEEITQVSSQVGAEVRTAVTSLQFQDMSTQLIGHVNKRIETLGDILDNLARLPIAARELSGLRQEYCEIRLRQFTEQLEEAAALVERARHNPVSQKSLATGDIELF